MAHNATTIDAAIWAAKNSHPYYWHSLDRLTFIPDPSVPTMATSARWVTHYNPATLAGWTVEEAGAVVVHELEHLLRDHAGRQGDREHGRWNIAADAEINQRLSGLPSGCVTPASLGMPEGRPAEVYYGATAPRQDPQPEEGEGETGEGEGSEGSGSGQPGEGSGSEEGSGTPEPGSGSGSGSGQPGSGTPEPDCGSASGGEVRPWEEGEEAAGQGIDPNGTDAADAREEAARAVLANGPQRGTGAGDELRDWAEGVIGIDRNGWYRALATALGHTLASSGTPTRWTWPGRRDPRDMGGAVLPRWASDRPAAAVIIDTSGSITQSDIEMARAAAVLLARIADVEFYGCDDRAERYGKTLPEHIRGGGGTDLRRGIAMAAADGARAIVLITDCATPWPSEEDMSRMGVPMVVGANASARAYPSDRTGEGYYEPPVTLTTIIPIIPAE